MNKSLKNKWNGSRLLGRTCLACLALALTGCSLLRIHRSPQKAEVTSLQLGTNASSAAVTTGVLQVQVMRFADSYVACIAQAADDFGAKVGTPKARLAALKWKLGQATSAYTDATGPNPVVNALDMLVLVSVSRMVVEDYGVGDLWRRDPPAAGNPSPAGNQRLDCSRRHAQTGATDRN